MTQLVRFFTLGSSAYTSTVLKELKPGFVPAVLLASLNKHGRREDFKGNPEKTFKKYYQTKKFPAVFVVGLWRDAHDFTRSDNNLAIQQVKKLQAQFNGKPIYFMPFLEHTQSAEFMAQTFQKLRILAPDIRLVNNPANYGGRTGDYVPGMLNELHYGARPNGQRPPLKDMIVCFDGVSAFDADFESWYQEFFGKVHMFSEWIPADNQRLNTNDTTPRPKRTHKPVAKDFRQKEHYLEHRKGETKFQRPKLYKSNADRHYPGNKDPRADSPLFILPQKGKQIILKDKNGKKALTFNYEQPYKGGGFIYRPLSFKKRGYEYAKKVIKDTGTAICDVFLDGEKIGTVNLAYRDGYYHD